MRILIVEDDASVARFLMQAVTEAGHTARTTRDGVEAWFLAQKRDYDLILLDVMLPGMSGFDVTRRLRSEQINTPILMITAKDTIDDKIEGLDAGADDYIVKPFQMEELLARMRALLRRMSHAADVLQVADISLNPMTRQVLCQDKTIHLSSTEFTLLEYLMRNAGQVLSRAMILEYVWQYDFNGNDNVLDVYISYLRRKLDKDRPEPVIQTVRGKGYCMHV